MRKAQKQQAEELVRHMEEAHDQIKKFIGQGSIPSAMELLEECQNGGITLGTLIENTEGEGHPAVLLLEEYCELVYQVHEDLAISKEVNTNKVYKILRQKLIKILNCIRNQVRVKMEVAFFPYKASMWDSLESVYLAAREDSECDVYFVPIPYYDLNPDHSFGKMHYEGDDYPEDIEVVDWTAYDFEKRKPDVIYIHNPYDGCNLVTSVHPRFYSSNLKKYTDTLVYIPYYSTSGGMSEAQSLCPAYIYADYIVIQSPGFRKYFDAGIPDQKFLPYGSPKFDRIFKKCQNPPEPSAEWKEKMAGKKVYFYNTSISGMLADTEAFLKKMNYVFECFEGREDVCLLWRPHPLLEATFDSMRPQYRHVYDDLKQMFLDKDLGILDTTPDIEDTIAQCDAYIGNAGTSVISLFGVAGKPVFLLNNKIHTPPKEEDWRMKIGISFDFQEQDQFMIIQGNKLYVSAPGEYNYRYFCSLSDKRRREYDQVLQIDGKKYTYSIRAQHILKIGDNGIEKKIELKQEKIEGRPFTYAWKYGRYVILPPLNYPAIVRFDTVTGECLYIKEHIDVNVKEKAGCKIVGGMTLYQGNLYLASPTDNKICKFDIESGEVQVMEIPVQSDCGCCFLVIHKGEFWSLPYTGNVITRWNPQTGESIEYADFPEQFSCIKNASDKEYGETPFSSITFCGDHLYLTPMYANMFLRLNIHTRQFAQWEISLGEVLEKGDNSLKTFLYWEAERESDCCKICSRACRLYKVHMPTAVWEEVEIEFDKEELQEHDVEFWKKDYLPQYAYIEGNFNSLGGFLDKMKTEDKFDRDKQLLAYSEVISNIDGSCGRKVHEYIKKQG